MTSYSCFQTNLLAKFVGIICIFYYIHSPYFMCQCTEYKLLALQVRISDEKTLNATTQQQNRRQKVLNRGALQFCWGAFCLCRRLNIIKLNNTPLIYSVSHFNFGGLGALFGGLSPPKPNRGDGTAQQSITAKISGCALKQGNKTHSSMRQRNLQLQNETVL